MEHSQLQYTKSSLYGANMVFANLIHFVYTISPYEDVNGDVVDGSLCCERLVSWRLCVRGWVDNVKAC
jgi:hypothetical protein